MSPHNKAEEAKKDRKTLDKYADWQGSRAGPSIIQQVLWTSTQEQLCSRKALTVPIRCQSSSTTTSQALLRQSTVRVTAAEAKISTGNLQPQLFIPVIMQRTTRGAIPTDVSSHWPQPRHDPGAPMCSIPCAVFFSPRTGAGLH